MKPLLTFITEHYIRFSAIVLIILFSVGIYYSYPYRKSDTIKVSGVIIKKDDGEKFHTSKSQEISDGVNYYMTISTKEYGYGCIKVDINSYYRSAIGSTVYFDFNSNDISQYFDKSITILPAYKDIMLWLFLLVISLAIFLASFIET